MDGTAQGLPVCVLYADLVKKRFDWYKNSNGVYVQIAALIECTIGDKSRLYVIGFHCTEAGVKATSTYPLPKIKYLITGTRNLPHMSCDEIDSISEPVAVIPSSMRCSSYFVQNILSRRLETFCIIPVGFIYRDDWDEIENEQLNLFRLNLLKKFNLLSYYNANENQKYRLFESVNNQIQRIGGFTGGTAYSDEEVIEEVIEMKRYIL